MDELSYLLHYDDDSIPLEANMTVGNHLDNDIMVPGEDVADFHLRIEMTDRGPVFIPLGEATYNINGAEVSEPVRAMLGDVIGIGQSTMQVAIEVEQASGVNHWLLVDEEGTQVDVVDEVSIGRAEGAELTIGDAHISRFHARLLCQSGYVWLQDLQSANGTRVNGERIRVGIRLFHGDEVSFDRFRYQLVGRGGDITPINRFIDPEIGSSEPLPDTTQTQTDVSQSRAPASTPEPSPSDFGSTTDAHLRYGDGKVLSILPGDNFLNRQDQAWRLGGANDGEALALINISVNGTRLTRLKTAVTVNESAVDSVYLNDGDQVQIGRDVLFYVAAQAPTVSAWQAVWQRFDWRVKAVAGCIILLLLILLLL